MSNQYLQIVNEVQKTQSHLNAVKQLAGQHSLLPSEHTMTEIQHKAQNAQLHIMFYGAYNAGKSTLINTILGSEQAKTADIPTTDSVDFYDWQGIKLLDTPGVNAPIEHQNVTEDQLKRVSAIVFVIRDGDMDSRDVYDRLLDLLKREKKIFIVLNNSLTNEADCQKAVEHIRGLLLKRAKENAVAESQLVGIEILPVRLNTALKGRLENKEKLVEHSGFTTFLTAFQSWLTRQNSEREKFTGFKNYVDEIWYQPILVALNSLRNAQDQQTIFRLEEKKSGLNTEKNLLINEVNSVIRSQIANNRNAILDTIKNATDELTAQNQIKTLLTNMSSKIEQALQDKLNTFSLTFKEKYDVPMLTKDPSNKLLDSVSDMTKEQLKNAETLKQALLLGRQFKIPMLKGRWEKTLGQWAGKAAVVAQIGLAVWDLYQENKAQSEQNERQRQYVLQLHQTVETICNDFEADALKSVEDAVEGYFSQEISNVAGQISSSQQQNDDIARYYDEFNQSQARLYALSW